MLVRWRTVLALLVAAMCSFALAQEPPHASFDIARPGYAWSFPRDHAAHPPYQTEWWYHTGHLDAADGRSFGFHLTFFRFRLGPGDLPPDAPRPDSDFAADELIWTHFAIADLARGEFHQAEIFNRAAAGVAGARDDVLHVWNGRWSLEATGDLHVLQADLTADDGRTHAMQLTLRPEKPLVLHGDDGYSQKGAGEGNASMYYSQARMAVDGTLACDGAPVAVGGTAWMDHEFGSGQLAEDQVGWDWFSMQLDDGSELMCYRMRRRDGSTDPHSSGTLVARDGTATRLRAEDFTIEPTATWTSPHTGGVYPAAWRIAVPAHDLALEVTPLLADQEMRTVRTGPLNYWEGAVAISGTRAGAPVAGRGYTELVGYDKPFDRDI